MSHAFGIYSYALPTCRDDYWFDGRQLGCVFLSKFKVALVMRRHRHHCPITVAHQHIVGYPHRHLLASKRMHNFQAGIHTFFVHGRHVSFYYRAMLALVDEGCELFVVLRGMCGQRMLGGYRAEGDTHDGVGAGGEHP